jgi:SAM-dependent methyltransferase
MYLLPHLTPGLSLLDVGAGPGTITADLAARVAPGRVTAVEINPEVLGLAQAQARAREQSNIEFVAADVHALGLSSDAFDVVHAHQVLQHVTDPVQALREMRRVCKPGGIVAARDGDHGASACFPAIPELAEWQALYRRVATANGGQPDAGRRLLSWAHAAGFTEVTAESATWCFATPEDRAWWGEMWAERTVASNLAHQAVRLGEATEEDLRRIAKGWLTWAAAEDGWLSILHGEIICRA